MKNLCNPPIDLLSYNDDDNDDGALVDIIVTSVFLRVKMLIFIRGHCFKSRRISHEMRHVYIHTVNTYRIRTYLYVSVY